MTEHHGELSKDHLLAHVTAFTGTHSRMDQDDGMLAEMLMDSVPEAAHESISIDREDCPVGTEISVALLFKSLLKESAVDSAIDPEKARLEISQATSKFKSLGHDVRAFNDWIKLNVSQLAQKE